ncbi:hypothetical protein K439DRAFT_1366972 [Ramaria rubella]|nr:hypothetical protein K439DRAFT_1366972 [Ramaria rubella]
MVEVGLEPINPSGLLPSQHHAYDIVTWHIAATIAGKNPLKLLMQIQGEGGTGKSKVIQTITDFFRTQ